MEPQHYILAANLMLSAVTLVYTVVLNRSKASSEWAKAMEGSHADMRQAHADLRQRLALVEGEVKHLPDRAQVQNIQLTLSDLRGELGKVAERMNSVKASSDRMQEFLFERGQK